MKIAISKLPNNPWWGTGVISYKDNPIMRDRVIPDQGLLIRERLNLINTMKNNKLDVVELSFPKELENNKYGHDYVFIRDTFISDLNGNALLLKFSQKNRNAESQIISGYLEKLDFNIKELPNKKNMFAEGGEFYYCPKENLLFSGLTRNSISGAEEVASFLKVNELIIVKTKAFHLDTVFTTVFDHDGSLCAVIVCKKLISKNSMKRLDEFASSTNIKIFNIPSHDAIGSSKNIGSLAVNNLSVPGLLISSSRFSDSSVIEKLDSMNIKMEVSQVSQFQLSGGSIHCLTNEL
ncbi:MAG: arginine deiminase-related protein [Candidatus Neomarinimicrobiota bacterium]|nr:arginine deiminase-related protein [Candidatus Neomarinimicrobiota bacterium]